MALEWGLGSPNQLGGTSKARSHMQQPPAFVGEAEVVAGAAVLLGFASSLGVGGGLGAAAPSSAVSPADAPVTVPGVPGCPTAGQSVSQWGSPSVNSQCNEWHIKEGKLAWSLCYMLLKHARPLQAQHGARRHRMRTAERQLLNRAHAGSTRMYHMPQKGRAALQVPRGKSVGLPRRMSGCPFGPTSD